MTNSFTWDTKFKSIIIVDGELFSNEYKVKLHITPHTADLKEQTEYLTMYNLKTSGLNQLVQLSYDLLGLQTYFTAGEKEIKAWTIKKNSTAPEAAGKIHTDFKKGFIKAETISYKDFIKYNGEINCRNEGKLRQEGKEYIVEDGDIFHFLFNVWVHHSPIGIIIMSSPTNDDLLFNLAW